MLRITPYFFLLGLLIFHFLLRYNTFWLSHLRGDQNHYTALALKLENFGLNGYKLRGIDNSPVKSNHKWGVLRFYQRIIGEDAYPAWC